MTDLNKARLSTAGIVLALLVSKLTPEYFFNRSMERVATKSWQVEKIKQPLCEKQTSICHVRAITFLAGGERKTINIWRTSVDGEKYFRLQKGDIIRFVYHPIPRGPGGLDQASLEPILN